MAVTAEATLPKSNRVFWCAENTHTAQEYKESVSGECLNAGVVCFITADV